MTYQYTAIGPDGKEVTGVIDAMNEVEAGVSVRQEYKVILSMHQVKSAKKKSILSMEIGRKKLNQKAFSLMCNEFSTILKSGLPISRAVLLIAEKTTDRGIKELLNSVASDIDAGVALSDSFSEHGKGLLPPTFVETLRAGEESGDLSKSFISIHDYFDGQIKMRAKVRKAMAYPLFVMAIAVVVVIVLMAKVVPTFTGIFKGYGSELPTITKVLIAASNGVRDGLPYFLVILLLIIIAGKLYGKTEQGKTLFARIKLMLPILGNIEQLGAASQFANTMTSMVGAGLPLTRCIQITSQVISNYIISNKVRGIVSKVEEGRTISSSMADIDELPSILTDMVAVGEETGELQKTLETVSEYYDNELDVAISSAISKLEPAMLVFLAGFAGFIVIAIYMSMFEMYNIM